MKSRKLLVFLVLTFALTSLAASALASPVLVNDFSELKSAIDGAASGDTICFSQNITTAETLTIKKGIILDGNGCTLTYTGANRAIDIPSDATDKEFQIKNLTVTCTATYCERGINFNVPNGTLLLDNVNVSGLNLNYAFNMPAMSSGSNVTITDGSYTGNFGLNVWGANATINATNVAFECNDKSTGASGEAYAAIKLNNDGVNAAENTVINITGGSIKANDDSSATTIATKTGAINTTNVNITGPQTALVASIIYDNGNSYGFFTLQGGVNKAIEDGRPVTLIRPTSENVTITAPVEINFNGNTNDGTFVLKNEQAELTVKGNPTPVTVYDETTGRLYSYKDGGVIVEIVSAPKTGDNSYVVLWAAMMALRAAAFVVFTKKVRFN